MIAAAAAAAASVASAGAAAAATEAAAKVPANWGSATFRSAHPDPHAGIYRYRRTQPARHNHMHTDHYTAVR